MEVLKSKKILLKDVLNEIGYSRQGIEPAIDKETIELRRLKKLCEVARINPAMFFENSTYGIEIPTMGSQTTNSNKVILDSNNKEIENLHHRINDKDEIIKLLKDKLHAYEFSNIAATPKTTYKK
jgi:molybdopterin converting factor small subunit